MAALPPSWHFQGHKLIEKEELQPEGDEEGLRRQYEEEEWSWARDAK